VSQYAGEIAVCLVISIVLSFVYIFLLKIMPKAMVFILIGLSLSILLIGSIVLLFTGNAGAGIPILIVFIVYALVLFCCRKQIAIGITLIKVASRFLT